LGDALPHRSGAYNAKPIIVRQRIFQRIVSKLRRRERLASKIIDFPLPTSNRRLTDTEIHTSELFAELPAFSPATRQSSWVEQTCSSIAALR
jgi:hypothetical protein